MIPWTIIPTVLFNVVLKVLDLIITIAKKKQWKRKDITEKQVDEFLKKHGDEYSLVRRTDAKEDKA